MSENTLTQMESLGPPHIKEVSLLNGYTRPSPCLLVVHCGPLSLCNQISGRSFIKENPPLEIDSPLAAFMAVVSGGRMRRILHCPLVRRHTLYSVFRVHAGQHSLMCVPGDETDNTGDIKDCIKFNMVTLDLGGSCFVLIFAVYSWLCCFPYLLLEMKVGSALVRDNPNFS